jgi:hypothetical protein
MHATEEGSGRHAIRILDDKGVLRYSGKVQMAESLSPAPQAPPLPEGLDPIHMGPERFYDGKTLFHGQAFHALLEIMFFGESWLMAKLKGAQALAWPEEDWILDPPLLDAAGQAGHVWGREKMGIFLLPGKLGRVHVYQIGLRQGPALAYADIKKRGRMGATIEKAYLVDEKTQQVFCMLEDCEVFGVSLAQAQQAMEEADIAMPVEKK